MEGDKTGTAGDIVQSLTLPPPPAAVSQPVSPSPPGSGDTLEPVCVTPVDDPTGDVTGDGGDAPPLLEIDVDHVGETEQSPPVEPEEVTVVVLTDELREKIVQQVEYYFSDENLPTDNFLLKEIKKNKGFVPIVLIASFRRMKRLVQDNSLIESALRTSSKLVLSSDGKKVKRINPFLDDKEEAKLRTVLVKNLPENCSQDYIRKKFGGVGNIKRVVILGNSQKAHGEEINKEKKFLNSKLHAYVEYETTEEAKNAVSSLNDESDWRSGLRVEPVIKQSKNGQSQKGRKCGFRENHNAKAIDTVSKDSEINCSEQSNEMIEQEGKPGSQDKNNVKAWSRRGRAPQQFHADCHGRGSISSSPSIESLNRPISISGPKMPDGTRGFAMGRGKPISLQLDG